MRRERKTFVLTGAAMLAVTLSSCGDEGVTAGTPRKVRVETVTSAGEAATAQYPGKVKASQDVSLSFRVSGVIERYCVEEGSRVSRGQLLVTLDPTDYEVQLAATEAEYKQVKSEAERVMALYADSVATPNDNDRAVYGLEQITAKRQHHADELSYTRLYAPFDGYVQKHLLEEHETVGAGTPVITMVSGDMPEVEINIPASEYVKRDSFTSYTCTFNTYPGEVYPLSLISITPKANSNELYTMRLRLLTDGKSRPAPGMNAMVTINRSAGDGRLTVSGSAVARENGASYVYVYDAADSTVSRRPVTVEEVLPDGGCTVSSPTLRRGDRVVRSGVRAISDGERVSAQEEPTETNVGGLL